MTEVLTSAQMRAIEAAAMASGAVTGRELMERAGRGVVEAIFARWPEWAPVATPGALPRTPGYLGQEEWTQAKGPGRAVILCGPGNNGGDGFVVARVLRELGWGVEVFLFGEAGRLPPDARVNYDRWCAMGEVRPLTEAGFHAVRGDIYVDALFGTGMTRPLSGEAQAVLCHMSGGQGDDYVPRTVAIDAPSGLCLDSGRALGVSEAAEMRGAQAMAALTVTFETAKPGHFLARGPEACGTLVVKPIGLWPWVFMERPVMREGVWTGDLTRQTLHCLSLPDAAFNPLNPRQAGRVGVPFLSKAGRSQQHKYSHGHALVLSGPVGRGGAARLAARGALRIGAGLVTVGCEPEAVAEHAVRLDAVMLREVTEGAALAGVLADRRITALCLGPGMGIGPREVGLVAVALGSGTAPEGRARRVVLDADALTILSREAGLMAALHEGCVLTPHAGEFARLFPDLAARLQAPATTGPAYSRVDACRAAAARAGCVVLLKGPDTVIAAPDGRCAINAAVYDRAAPWLATAGSGDVLAGFITGLLARGFQPFEAACTGAWLHVEAARCFGPGLIAEDLPEALPEVFRALGL